MAITLMRRTVARSIATIVNRLGFEIRRIRSVHDCNRTCTDVTTSYTENLPDGPSNLKIKLDRAAHGGPFEWPDMLALNKAVAGMCCGARRIVELGGGTGAFAFAVASINEVVNIVCSELDEEASRWAAENRALPNISYVSRLVEPDDGPFDLLVSIDVIEHIGDFRHFLNTCCRLAPRAIITTPNKNRSVRSATAGPPAYPLHVREWTAGEFYWVLRCFYERVELFSIKSVGSLHVVPIDVTDAMTPLIAVCESPVDHAPHSGNS